MMESFIGWILLVPPVAVLLMPWASRLGRWAANTLAVVAAGLPLYFTLRLIPAVGGGLEYELFGARFALDSVSLLFLVVVNAVAFACMIYATSYVSHLGGRGKFFALLLIMVFGLNAMLLTRDLFSLYLFLEVASIASYVLVAFGLEHDGIESAVKYLLLSSVATSMVLIGIMLVYMNAGTLEFASLAAALEGTGGPVPGMLLLAAALFIAGFGLKAAVMPFHAWLPDAHPSAPAPISAMLSGVVIKVAGVYALARIFFGILPEIGEVRTVFLVLGTISMIAGAVLAYFQRDFKRILAYSSISQIGYILLGLGLGNLLGLIGALFHVFNHALFKSLLFLNSGAVQYRLGTRDIEQMGGLENRMPVTAATSVFGTLSIAGIPPFNGFWSKLFIIMGALAAGQTAVATLAILVSVFTLGYFLIIQRKVFFGHLNEKWRDIREAPAVMSLAVILLAATCLLTGVFFHSVTSGIVEPAAVILLGGN
ncbi:MAG: proton-conducting transporter membrane subunit [Acidobacteriota bacterium]|jgi:multicomponent Na+:H+ antiporter subunit D|nr:proton-conducting transporter membrane subunit [Acidobacteriota bacterium]NLT31967.1 NADH/ubiquinone/plastoquinone (complex I) [Acidobacteriota bacterium]